MLKKLYQGHLDLDQEDLHNDFKKDEFIDLFNRKGFGNVLSDDGVHPKHTIYEMPLE